MGNLKASLTTTKKRFPRAKSAYFEMLYIGSEESNPELNGKVRDINMQIKSFCDENGHYFVAHNALQTGTSDLYDDDVHMNDCTNSIDPDKWQRHFRSVLDPSEPPNVDQQHSDYVLSSLPIIESVVVKNDVINAPIYSKELLETAASLKAGKAMYLDEISNDAIKCGIRVLEAPLLHLYNHVLSLGSFPQTWSDVLIIPLHKKNDKLCIYNYRGLIISSCVGKLFTKILTKRIDKFMRENGLWKFNQCGFKADHRTEDNLFILNTIYEKYINTGNETLYTAFVDFSKFFDKINRKFLLYKLLKYNITGNVYNIIKRMYSNTSYQILINGNLSPRLSASLGVKQGYCMSRALYHQISFKMTYMIFLPNATPLYWKTFLLIVYHGRMIYS